MLILKYLALTGHLIKLSNAKKILLHQGYAFLKEINCNRDLIALSNGKKLIMLKKYTYSNKGQSNGRYRWNCTTPDCKSYLLVSANLDIEKVVERHDHKPPKYKLTPRGTYFEKKWSSKK